MLLESTASISLLIQILVSIIDFWGISIEIPKDKKIFKDLLKLELGVQIVEFTFYTWLVLNIKNIKNITPYRYIDWFITTPTMLLTLMVFLLKDDDNNKYSGLSKFIEDNKRDLILVGLANALMLVFWFIRRI